MKENLTSAETLRQDEMAVQTEQVGVEPFMDKTASLWDTLTLQIGRASCRERVSFAV